MIKTFLKHWIYEICIDQLFNGFKNNFLTSKKNVRDIKEGMTFDYIEDVPKSLRPSSRFKYPNVMIRKFYYTTIIKVYPETEMILIDAKETDIEFSTGEIETKINRRFILTYKDITGMSK